MARELNRLVTTRLRYLEPKDPLQRCESQTPGELIDIEVQKLARLRQLVHRITASRQQGTAFNFLSRAVAWFNGQGMECRQMMSENGSTYISKALAKACRLFGVKHIRTRLCTPRTNGKAVRFIQTLCREWAYSMHFQNSEGRNRRLPRHLSTDNRLRKRSAIAYRPPQQQLSEVVA